MQLQRTVCQTEVAAEQFSRKGGNSLPIPRTDAAGPSPAIAAAATDR